jgi:tight adherence protein C
MLDIWIILAAVAAAAGVFGFGFALFTMVPLGRPTVHLVPDSAPAIAAPPRSPRSPRPARLTGVAPQGYVRWIERQIVYAGRAGEWSASAFLAIKLAVAVPGVVLGVFAANLYAHPFWIGIGVFIIVISLVGPDVFLNSRADDRQSAIQRALPDTLDQMTIAVEAGLGFDSAMSKAAINGRGPLAEELVRALQDMSIGRSRRDAYKALELRTSSEDLRRFIRAVSQADKYGISIAEVLRVQAGEMRVKRRQRAEAQALKVPVKIVFPLVFCILPVLFIVLLTPAVLGVFEAFSR